MASWGTQVSRSLARRGGSRRRARASVPPAIPGGSGTVPVRRGSCGGLRPPSCGWAGRVPTGGAVPSVVGRHPAHRGGRSLPASRSSWGRAGPVGVAGRAPFSGVPVGGRRCPERFRASSGSWAFGIHLSCYHPSIGMVPWVARWGARGCRGSFPPSRPVRAGPGAGVGRRAADREFGWGHPHSPCRSGLPVWSPVSGSGGWPGGVHSLHGSSLGSHGAADPVSSFRVRDPLRS